MQTSGLLSSPVKQTTALADTASSRVADAFSAALAEFMSTAGAAAPSAQSGVGKTAGKRDLRGQAGELPPRDNDEKPSTTTIDPNLLLPVPLAANVIPVIAPSFASGMLLQAATSADGANDSQSGKSFIDLTAGNAATQAIPQPPLSLDGADQSRPAKSFADLPAGTAAAFARAQSSTPFSLNSPQPAPSRMEPILAPADSRRTQIVPGQATADTNSAPEVVSKQVTFANLKSVALPDVEAPGTTQVSSAVSAGAIFKAQVKPADSKPLPPATFASVHAPSTALPDGVTTIVAKFAPSGAPDVRQRTPTQDARGPIVEAPREALPLLSSGTKVSTISPMTDLAQLCPSPGTNVSSAAAKGADEPADPLGTQAPPPLQLIDVPPTNVPLYLDLLTPQATNAVLGETPNVLQGRKAFDVATGKVTQGAAVALLDELRSANSVSHAKVPQVTDAASGGNPPSTPTSDAAQTSVQSAGQSATQSKNELAKKSSTSTLQAASSSNDAQPTAIPAAGPTVAVPSEPTAAGPPPLKASDTRDTTNAGPLTQSPQQANSPDNARITTDAAGEMQMRVGIRTTAFGAVEIYTSVHQNQVGLSVHSERGMEHWFGAEVQSLETGLKDHHLHLSTMEMDRSGTGFQTSTGSQQQHSQRSFAAARNWRGQRTAEPPVEAAAMEPPNKGWTAWPGENRVSIRI
jgi:hypothetical protein